MNLDAAMRDLQTKEAFFQAKKTDTRIVSTLWKYEAGTLGLVGQIALLKKISYEVQVTVKKANRAKVISPIQDILQ